MRAASSARWSRRARSTRPSDRADRQPFVELEAARLEELRLEAVEKRIDAELELQRHEQLVAELDALASGLRRER